jgi:hypothetical protein
MAKSDRLMAESEYLPVKKPNIRSKNVKERKLAEALRRYTYRYSDTYDAEFNCQIRALQPHWFVRHTNADGDGKRKKLLQMAANGEKRPSSKSKDPAIVILAAALSNYLHRGKHLKFIAEISRLRPNWINKSAFNKKRLLEMARSGKPKPKPSVASEKCFISMLQNYTRKQSRSYDQDFDREIHLIRPDWFEDTTAPKKQKLLEMARKGEKRPTMKSDKRLSWILTCYISKNNESYDPKFDAEIRALRPDWFENKADLKKQKLIEMARKGQKRPNFHSKDKGISSALMGYTNTKSSCYDPEFDAEIRTLRLDWFERTAIRNADGSTSKRRVSSALKKQKLLEMARKGGERPNSRSTKLGSALICYTNIKNGSYDPAFDAEIRALRPSWFEDTAIRNLDGSSSKHRVSSATKKLKLLKLAKSGAKRPSGSSKDITEKRLSWVLGSYTIQGGNYDIEFDTEIRKLRPDWFENTAASNKQKLLEMARNGEKRPNSSSKDKTEKHFSTALVNYTNQRGDTYDREFDIVIRAIRPDWFKRKRRGPYKCRS